MLFVGTGCADSWQNIASARLSTEHDSNPVMSATNTQGVTRTSLRPGYELIGTFERDELQAGLAVQIERSSNQVLSQNRDSPTAHLDWKHQLESGEFGISSRYTEIASRDTEIAATANAVGTTKSRFVSGRWSNELSERSTLDLDGSYLNVTYDGGTNIDYVTRSAAARYNYAWSESSTPFVRISNSKYEPASGGTSSSLSSAWLGSNWKTEYLDWTVQLGRSKDSAGNSNSLASATAGYTGQKANWTLIAEHLVMPTGQGGFALVNQGNLRASYALSEYTSSGFDLSSSRSTSASSSSSGAGGGVWLENRLTQTWRVRTYLQRRISRENTSGSASSNTIGLSLEYADLRY